PRFRGGSATDVHAEVGLRPDQLGEIEKFLRSELIALLDSAPAVIDGGRPLRPRADAGAPVISVGVAAAGPTNDRHMQLLQRLDDVAPVAVDVRDRRILTDPNAAVDPVPQLLGEMTVDFRRDSNAGRVRVDRRARLD